MIFSQKSLFPRLALVASLLFGAVATIQAADPVLKNVTVQVPSLGSKKVIFLYQETSLSQSNGRFDNDRSRANSGYLSDVRFPEFGDLMIANGKKHLSDLNVTVVHVGFVPENKLSQYIQQLTDLLGSNEMQNCIYVVVSPLKASLSRYAGSTTASISFSVQATDASTSKKVWASTFDTETRSGMTFMRTEIFDDTYAEKIFRMLVSRLKNDQIL